MSSSIAIADCEWLVSPAAQDALRFAVECDQPLHQLAAALRKEHSQSRTALLLDQRELRHRARGKFARAADMFFTRVALEQATDEWVAGYKAQRFADFESIGDVCCGIGGDLIALAAVGAATGVDQSGVAASLASANLRANQQRGDIEVGNATSDFVRRFDAWHADPDRRYTGARTTEVSLHSPDAATLNGMLRANPTAAIKLAPASAAPSPWQEHAELEWISRDRECRQQVAWFGGLASAPGQRRATRIHPQHGVQGTFVAAPGCPSPVAGKLGDFLYEPDPSVLAAMLQGPLAAAHSLPSVAANIAYFTSDNLVEHGLLARFRVLDLLPSIQTRLLAAYFRERGVGRLEIKHRGMKVDPDSLRKRLKLSGDNQAVLFLFPFQGKPVGLVCERHRAGAQH